MSLYVRLMAEARRRQLSLFALKRVETALQSLERDLGPMSELQLAGEVPIAGKVQLVDDPATYVVVGTWEDGSCDIVREQALSRRDWLIGWVPGQALKDYKAQLAQEKLEEIDEPDGNVRSFRRPVANSKRP